MITILVGAVIVPILRKLGERWIDRVAELADAKVVALLKGVAKGGDADELKDYLGAQPLETTKQLASDLIAASVDPAASATSDPEDAGADPAAALLPIYTHLLNVGAVLASHGRRVFVAGFLNDAAAICCIESFGDLVPSHSFVNDGFSVAGGDRAGAWVKVPRPGDGDVQQEVARLQKRVRVGATVTLDAKDGWLRIDRIEPYWLVPRGYDLYELGAVAEVGWMATPDDRAELDDDLLDFLEVPSVDGIVAFAQGLSDLGSSGGLLSTQITELLDEL